MNINYKGTHTSLTEADQNFIEEKLSALDKFIGDADKVFVEAEREVKHKSGLVFRLEVSINPPSFYAEARGNDFYEALDLVVPKIKEQLVKQKDKRVSLRRRKTSLKGLK
jgi:putative sigma-54 modulation protein